MSKAVARATAVLMLTGAVLRLPHRDHGAEARVEALPLVGGSPPGRWACRNRSAMSKAVALAAAVLMGRRRAAASLPGSRAEARGEAYRGRAVQPGTAMTAHGDEVRCPRVPDPSDTVAHHPVTTDHHVSPPTQNSEEAELFQTPLPDRRCGTSGHSHGCASFEESPPVAGSRGNAQTGRFPQMKCLIAALLAAAPGMLRRAALVFG
jgi:hypothetical protein